ncbi:MAG TPA: response regulator [Opitutaceae bacterium]|nr:response regulator [Opitutaceae bacterium]
MSRILLVDDDDMLRGMLARLLAHHGHTAVEARNGQVALKLFADARVDLVLTDIVMPEVEGLAVLMELRKLTQPIKIIAMSGGGRQGAMDYLKAARQLGAIKVLTKPFSNDALMAAIEEVLAVATVTPPADGRAIARGENPGVV